MKEGFREEAALRILCAIGDKIELPEWDENGIYRNGELVPKVSMETMKVQAACWAAVKYADALIEELEKEETNGDC